MTREAAQLEFYSQFLTAYPTTDVPNDVTFPYLTYEPSFAAAGEQESKIVKMWFYTRSEAEANAKAREFAKAIGLGGIKIKHDSGGLWIKRGTPFLISAIDNDENLIKLRQFNIEVEGFGAY